MKNNIKITVSLLCAITVLMSAGCAWTDSVKNKVTEFLSSDTNEDGEVTVTEPPKINSDSITVGVCDFDILHPLLSESESVMECLELIYEPLFNMNEFMQPEPVLAQDYSLSPDGTQLDVNLKQGVLWHDGGRFDSYDVEYTINQIKAYNTPYTKAAQDIVSCARVSDSCVRIRFSRPVPNPALLLAFPIIKYRTPMNKNTAYAPVGTGPFKYMGQISAERYLMNKNESWHGGSVTTDMVFLDMLPNEEYLKTAFEANEIDVITDVHMDLKQYMPKGGASIHDFVTNKLTFLGFNIRKSVFASENTRKAINEIIDKEEIEKSVIYSRGVAVDIPINPISTMYYDSGQSFKQNLPTASFYLDADGWHTDSAGTYLRNNGAQELTFSILTNGESLEKIEVANNIAKKLRSVGIAVRVEEASFADYSARIAAGNFDAFIGEVDLGINHDPMPLISSAGNYFGYYNPSAQSVLELIGMSSDENELRELYKQYGEYMRNDMPFITLYYRKEALMTSSKIKDGVAPAQGNFFRNAGLWTTN